MTAATRTTPAMASDDVAGPMLTVPTSVESRSPSGVVKRLVIRWLPGMSRQVQGTANSSR